MKKKIALTLNLLIIIFELIGFILTYTSNGRIAIEYYTEDSNIIALITSTLFVIYLLLNKKIPYYLKLLKYISTITLTVTFLVVIFILAPMYNFNYNYLLFSNELLFHHLLCPLLSIISFIFFDQLESYTVIDNILSTLVTIFYGIIIIILNIIKIVDGPYPFLKIYNQPLLITLIWAFLIIGMSYIIALIIRKLKR